MPEQRPELSGNGGEALAWADTYAHVGDYRFALRWLELADGLVGRPLTPAYEAKRALWRYAAGEDDATAVAWEASGSS